MIIQGMSVYTEEGVLQNSGLLIENGKIQQVQSLVSEPTLTFPEGYHMLPGFIDVHVHGLAGFDVMDGELHALRAMSAMLACEGTTSFLATTMTAPDKQIEKALTAVDEHCKTAYSGAEVLGVHLEGPFISISYAGAQAQGCIKAPDMALFSKWQALSNNRIKVVTLAPELSGAIAFIRHITEQNVVASIGHTDADAKTTLRAIEAGARHGTHVFNAMKGLHHREPGTVTPLLLHDKVSVEMIADHIHLHPMMLDLICRVKGEDRVMLITDAMRAKCLGDGNYNLGGQQVHVKNGEARLENGCLAGSLLTLPKALRHLLASTHCDLHAVSKMLSANPAKQLGIFNSKGSVAPGKDADLVVLNEEYDVVLTVCRGNIAYLSERFSHHLHEGSYGA